MIIFYIFSWTRAHCEVLPFCVIVQIQSLVVFCFFSTFSPLLSFKFYLWIAFAYGYLKPTGFCPFACPDNVRLWLVFWLCSPHHVLNLLRVDLYSAPCVSNSVCLDFLDCWFLFLIFNFLIFLFLPQMKISSCWSWWPGTHLALFCPPPPIVAQKDQVNILIICHWGTEVVLHTSMTRL